MRITDARRRPRSRSSWRSTLTVSAVSSPNWASCWRCASIGQNNLLIGLPRLAQRGDGSRSRWRTRAGCRRRPIDREAIAVAGTDADRRRKNQLIVTPEPRFMYSNRVQWYPQGVASDYATARAATDRAGRISDRGERPDDRIVGLAAPSDSPVAAGPTRTSEFVADRPVRYLACLISKFQPIGRRSMRRTRAAASAPRDAAATAGCDAAASVNVDVLSTPRMVARNRQTPARAAAMLQFYAKTIGEAPYPESHGRGARRQSAGRPQPGVFRRAASGAADDAVFVGVRSGGVRQRVSAVLSRARNRASVVGTGGRLAELSRPMAERGTGAVLRRALRRRGSRARRCCRR